MSISPKYTNKKHINLIIAKWKWNHKTHSAVLPLEMKIISGDFIGVTFIRDRRWIINSIQSSTNEPPPPQGMITICMFINYVRGCWNKLQKNVFLVTLKEWPQKLTLRNYPEVNEPEVGRIRSDKMSENWTMRKNVKKFPWCN